MKRIAIYHYICFGLIIVSMFLPYNEYDQYTSFSFFGSSSLIEESQHEIGFNFPPAWVLPGLMAITIITLHIKRNLATAIIGLIFGFLNLLYLPLLGFILVFTLFGSQRNKTIDIGFVLAGLVVITYFGFLISHLVKVVKERRKPKNQITTNLDVLDDSDLLDTI